MRKGTDNAWFESKVRELGNGMYVLAVSILKNEADAEDAIQNALLLAYHNIDKRKGKLVSLSGLFTAGFDYVSVLSSEIRRQMKEQMQEKENIMYWVYPDNNTCSGFYQIKEEQNFYFNEDGNLVIAFDKYEVAPGYMGCPEFIIPREKYESFLK